MLTIKLRFPMCFSGETYNNTKTDLKINYGALVLKKLLRKNWITAYDMYINNNNNNNLGIYIYIYIYIYICIYVCAQICLYNTYKHT